MAKVNWYEIPSRNLNRAGNFYETIFGIKLEHIRFGATEMLMFPADREGDYPGAIVFHPDHYRPSHDGVLIYLDANPDQQKVLDRVIPAGGKVIVQKRQVNEQSGFMAVIEDSEGNRIALHSQR